MCARTHVHADKSASVTFTIPILPPQRHTSNGDVCVLLPWFQARYRREHVQQRNVPSLPLVENLLKDNTDGCALTALLHLYCPQAVRLEGEANSNHTHPGNSLTAPSFI